MLPFLSCRPGGDFAPRVRRQPIVWLCCLVVLITSFGLTCSAQDGKAEPPKNPFPQAVPVPEGILDGGTEWLNTGEPISLRQLRGKIVLLDFWTYCCINCMHVLPDLKYLEEKYGAQLVVIGVHSAKFDNEKDSDNIRNAIMRYEIRHPVVNDSEMQIWRKFGTQAWPTLALIDPEGNYVGSQSGEGNRELFDLVIGKLVEYHRWKGTLDETPLVFRMESDKAQPTPLRFPGKVLADAASGRVFISDSNHNRIVVAGMDGQLIETIGSGRMGKADGAFADAEFDHPQGMALVGQQLFVADTENHLIRVVNLETKQVATLAGTGRQGRPGIPPSPTLLTTDLNSPWSLVHSKGTLFIAMAGPHQIWSHALGTESIGPWAGSGREDVINGPRESSAFAQPSELVVDEAENWLYVVDSEGSAIRRVPVASDGLVSTIAGTSELPRGQSLFAFGDVDAVGADARFQHPLGIVVKGDSLFVADSYNHKIRQIDLKSQAVSTLIGTGRPGNSLDPPLLNEPGGLSLVDEKLFVADTNNHRICIVDLGSRQMSEFTVHGLQPPSPAPIIQVPDASAATQLSPVTQKTESAISVTVDLNVPKDYKLNDLAPVTWEVFVVNGAALIPADVVGTRDEATVSEKSAQFRIPVTAEAGTAQIVIRMTYGYCQENSTLCRLATGTWKLDLTTAADAPESELKFSFSP